MSSDDEIFKFKPFLDTVKFQTTNFGSNSTPTYIMSKKLKLPKNLVKSAKFVDDIVLVKK